MTLEEGGVTRTDDGPRAADQEVLVVLMTATVERRTGREKPSPSRSAWGKSTRPAAAPFRKSLRWMGVA